MAESSWPFQVSSPGDPGDVDEDAWTKMARLFADTGVVGDPGDSILEVFADSSGMQVFVRAGVMFIRGHYYVNSTQKTVSIASNGAGSARIDRIVVRLDPTANTITAVRLAGTAGNPAPAVTQTDVGTYEVSLAQVRVEPGASSIAAGKVTDERKYAGTSNIACDSSLRPSAPRAGQLVYETDNDVFRYWNGSTWKLAYDPNDIVTHTDSDLRTEAFFDTATENVTAITDFAASSPSGTFVAPPSGRILVHIYSYLLNNSSEFTKFGWQIWQGTSGSGTLKVAADDNRSVGHEGTTRARTGATFYIGGLTPGATHFIRGYTRVTGGQGTTTDRRIIVQPLF